MTISKIFRPKFQYILQRIEKKNDGGYLVGPFAVQNSKYLISYGINDDWSFEKNFYKLNHNIKIITYDDKLNFFFLFNRLVINFFKIFIPGYKSYFFRPFFNIFDYFYFIKKTYKKKKRSW
jgi:hypothetical protein